MQYQLQANSRGEVQSVTIVGQAISIPFDPANVDFQAYQQWLAEGNEPLPADAPEVN